MKHSLLALSLFVAAFGAHAQAGTAVKEAGKATAETARQGVANTRAAIASEPEKSVQKAKAHAHKENAKDAATASKAAAKEAVK